MKAVADINPHHKGRKLHTKKRPLNVRIKVNIKKTGRNS